jgi:hypothetical protein
VVNGISSQPREGRARRKGEEGRGKARKMRTNRVRSGTETAGSQEVVVILSRKVDVRSILEDSQRLDAQGGVSHLDGGLQHGREKQGDQINDS